MGKRKSPWPVSHRMYKLFRKIAWGVFCHFTPKPFSVGRLFVLRCFGREVSGISFVHQSAKIENSRNLKLEDKAWIGANTVLYSLDRISIGDKNSIVDQESYPSRVPTG
jgi:putative colanic acid biosynthesis acetyltransferase WcaF